MCGTSLFSESVRLVQEGIFFASETQARGFPKFRVAETQQSTSFRAAYETSPPNWGGHQGDVLCEPPSSARDQDKFLAPLGIGGFSQFTLVFSKVTVLLILTYPLSSYSLQQMCFSNSRLGRASPSPPEADTWPRCCGAPMGRGPWN